MSAKKILVKFLTWRIKHVDLKNFVLVLSGVVGVIAGFAAVSLKESVHFIQHFLKGGFQTNYANLLYIAYPVIGIVLTGILAHVILKIRLGHGIPDILYAISKKSSHIRRHKMYSSMLTSAATVGFGGSVGLEAPIVVTGSAIGGNIARLMHLNYKKRTLLIGCGAAGAISAIFNSPVTGVIFAVEVILTEVTIAAFIPLLIASVFGYLVSMTLSGDDTLFYFKLTDAFTAADVPFFMGLGVVCALVSLYFTNTINTVENWVTKRFSVTWQRTLLGAILLGLVIFVFPPLYGEGYQTIKALLNGREQEILHSSLFFNEFNNLGFLLVFSIGILLIKPVATALTIGSGGSGGIFAPSLFLGGVTGFVYSKLINLITQQETISTSNFTLVAMCGVMSAVLHAPLTAIFLIAEITSGYTLFVPLMLVSAISYSTISYFEKYSLYTKSLIERGDLIQGDKDRQLLSLIDLSKIIETDLYTIRPDAKLEDLTELVKLSKRNIFPVVNNKQELMGIVTLDDIRKIMFDTEAQQKTVIYTLMHAPPASVSLNESMQSVMLRFEKTGAWNLPVIDEGKYIGFVSKSRIFNAYRKKLIRQHKE